MPIYMPVDPTLDQGKIRVLVPLFGEAGSKPYPEQAPAVDGTTGISPDPRYYQTTARVAASLGLGDVFRVDAEGFDEVMVMDTIVGIPRYRAGVIPPEVKVLGTYWGFSVRVAMRIRTSSATANADLGLLAAAVEVGAAEIQYSVSAVGIDRAIFAAALASVPLFGTLNYTAYARLSASIDALMQALAARLTSQPLLPIGVFLRDDPFDTDVVSEGRSVRWAMTRIANGIKGDVALDRAPAWLDEGIAREVYGELVGADLTLDVGPDAADAARDWLKVG